MAVTDKQMRLLIIDGHAFAYRAFYAIRGLNSPTGQPTNAIYGFINMLSKLEAQVLPTHSVVVWDGGLAEGREGYFLTRRSLGNRACNLPVDRVAR